jgi:hypothetical protein
MRKQVVAKKAASRADSAAVFRVIALKEIELPKENTRREHPAGWSLATHPGA